MASVFLLMMFAWLGSVAVKRFRQRSQIRLRGDEVSALTLFGLLFFSDEGCLLGEVGVDWVWCYSE